MAGRLLPAPWVGAYTAQRRWKLSLARAKQASAEKARMSAGVGGAHKLRISCRQTLLLCCCCCYERKATSHPIKTCQPQEQQTNSEHSHAHRMAVMMPAAEAQGSDASTRAGDKTAQQPHSSSPWDPSALQASRPTPSDTAAALTPVPHRSCSARTAEQGQRKDGSKSGRSAGTLLQSSTRCLAGTLHPASTWDLPLPSPYLEAVAEEGGDGLHHALQVCTRWQRQPGQEAVG